MSAQLRPRVPSACHCVTRMDRMEAPSHLVPVGPARPGLAAVAGCTAAQHRPAAVRANGLGLRPSNLKRRPPVRARAPLPTKGESMYPRLFRLEYMRHVHEAIQSANYTLAGVHPVLHVKTYNFSAGRGPVRNHRTGLLASCSSDTGHVLPCQWTAPEPPALRVLTQSPYAAV